MMLFAFHIELILKEFRQKKCENTKKRFLIVLYSHDQLYTYTRMQKHIQHNKEERTLFFRKNIPLTLLKGLCVRGSWRPKKDCNILTPAQLFWLSQPFFPVLLSCSSGGLGALPLLGHSSHSSILSPTDLNFLSPVLYDNLTSTYFLRSSQIALHSTPRQSRSPPDIFDWMHL